MLIFVRLILFPPLTFDTYSTFYFDFDFLFTLWFFIFIQNFSSICFCYILTYIQQLSMHIYILYRNICSHGQKYTETVLAEMFTCGNKNFRFLGKLQCRPHTIQQLSRTR